MDSVWFRGKNNDGLQQQEWFIHIGVGRNIRTAVVPLRLTKAMSHFFSQAPKHYSAYQALRWGQIRALGGSPELVEHVIVTRLGSSFENESFWVSVIHFFANNPMLNHDYIGPIIDFISARKFDSREVPDARGRITVTGPPDPNFTMRGRRVRPLLQLVDKWHARLSTEKRSPSVSWNRSGIRPFEHLEEDPASGHVLHWTIRELVTPKEIVDEGKAMRHCVATYVPACAKGQKSVWSMQVEDTETGAKKRVLTIAVKNDAKTVVQARGTCNAMPNPRASDHTTRVAGRERDLLKRGRALMRIWGCKVGVRVPLYT